MLRIAAILLAMAPAGTLAQSAMTYRYDALGRLTTVRNGIGSRSDYSMDSAGNRSTVQSAAQFSTFYDATSLPHIIGYADGNGWAVDAGPAGHMTYGPYTTSVPVGNHVATWRVLVDNNTAGNAALLYLDVWDATTNQTLGSLQVTRQQWVAPWAYQVFEVPFSMSASGHQIEMRTYAYGASYIRVNKVGYY